MSTQSTRRRFIQQGVFTILAAGSARTYAANERLDIGIVGVVNRAKANLNGVAPLAQLYRIEELIAENERDTELADTGSPELRALNSWALLLCARKEDSLQAAERAELDAGLCGLATVAGRARVLRGESHQEWNGQARLLAQLLEFASSETPPPSDRETGAIPLHGPRAR